MSDSKHKPPTGTLAARPSSDFKLSDRERDILADPNWVTEDEADIIVAMRREHETPIPFEDVLADYGETLED